MFIADRSGVLSSIIYGPDQKTRITEHTSKVLFTTYAPPGVGRQAIVEHLNKIASYAEIVSPPATVEQLEVLGNG
jgi:hypothetical protein